MFQIWMGDLRSNMTESFLMRCFNKLGAKPLSVRIQKRYSRNSIHAFIHFKSQKEVIDTIDRLNGKPIPNTFPVSYFNLSNASRDYGPPQEEMFLLWVGELTPDVTDYSLYKLFSSKYSSIINAKVMVDSFGSPKGFGYVGFGIESQQKHAFRTMNGYVGLGNRPMRVGDAKGNPNAADKARHILSTVPVPTPENNRNFNRSHHKPHSSGHGHEKHKRTDSPKDATTSKTKQENNLLVDYDKPIDVNSLNKEMKFLDRHWSLWDSMADSQWIPRDSYTSLYLSSFSDKSNSNDNLNNI